jgi:hypothetical protein
LNNKVKIALIAAAIVAILLLVVAFLAVRGGDSATGPERLRLNTLTLVRSYVDKGEYDRALSLLEGLLIENPATAQASELLDIVPRREERREALEGGNGEANRKTLSAR